ncbi:MAG: tyrosine-type recombinase/integrase, partial [Acidimicrobiia bacterium]
MSTQTVVAAAESVTDLLGDYLRWVDGLEMTSQGKRLRRLAAERFVASYPDLHNWMTRPTPARVADLGRTRGWTFLTWCFCVGHLAPDIDLLAAVGAGNHYVTWGRFNSDDVDRAAEVGRRLGWAESWIRLVCVTGMGMVCLWAQKRMDELGDADLEAFEEAVDEAPSMSANHRHKAINYLFGVRQVLYQLGITDLPPRHANQRTWTLPERVATIPQPEIRRVALRYLEVVSTTLRPKTVTEKAAALVLLGEYLAANHPEIEKIADLDRAAHIEPFLAFNLGRPWRGRVARDQPVSLHRSLQAVVDLKGFFEDLAIWGWADQPRRQLMFGTDLPRLPEPLPRALPPNTDRDLMAAVAELSDPAARYGIQILRGTGMRIGELFDLELDCLWDTPNHGTWVKVPLGKLDNERMVPLDPDTLAGFDAWMAYRQPQRSL